MKGWAMDERAISNLLGNVLAALGLELDGLEASRAGKRGLLRVFVDGDGPDGHGPDMDQIAEATRAVSRALDDNPAATGDAPYLLEVSSRGVGRPLSRPAHYRRNIGRLLAVTTADKRAVTGRIAAADEQSVTLETEAAGPLTLAYGDIAKAVVQVELTKPKEED
jgi:ribosome maturation factor RimP